MSYKRKMQKNVTSKHLKKNRSIVYGFFGPSRKYCTDSITLYFPTLLALFLCFPIPQYLTPILKTKKFDTPDFEILSGLSIHLVLPPMVMALFATIILLILFSQFFIRYLEGKNIKKELFRKRDILLCSIYTTSFISIYALTIAMVYFNAVSLFIEALNNI